MEEILLPVHKLYMAGMFIEICLLPVHISIHGNEKVDALVKDPYLPHIMAHSLPIENWLITLKK